MIFVGVDWAEAHNDVLVMDQAGAVLGRGRLGVGVAGLAGCTAWWPSMPRSPGRWSSASRSTAACWSTRWWAPVMPSTRSPGGQPLPQAPHHLGRQVGCRRCQAAGRPGAHRCPQPPPAGRRLGQASAIRVLARAHQGLVWARQRQVNRLRAALRDYFPVPFRPSAATWPHPMPWRCSQSPRRPRQRARSRAPRSPRPWPARAVSATWIGGRPRSRPCCGPTTTRRPRPWPMPLVRPVRRASPCSSRSARSPPWSASWASILIVTRTPRSCAESLDSARSSAPGCSASSEDSESLRRC